IGAVDRTADTRDRRGEAFAEIAAIERVRAVARDGLETDGEVPLLKHLSGAGPAAARAEDLSGLLVASDAVSFPGDRIGKDIAHRKAVLGITDRRSERALETEADMVGATLCEPPDERGHHGDRRDLRWRR